MTTRPTPLTWTSLPLQQHQQDAPAPIVPPVPVPPVPPVKTFTQAEVDAMIAERVNKEKGASAKEIADKLGITLDEAAKVIADKKAEDDKQKTEAQLATEKAIKEADASAAATASAKAAEHDTKVLRALVLAGVPILATEGQDQKVIDDRLAKIGQLVSADVGADDATITAAVTSLQTSMPELFAPQVIDPNAPKPPPSNDPNKPPNKTPKPAENAMQRGAERAKAAGGQKGYAWENDAAATT